MTKKKKIILAIFGIIVCLLIGSVLIINHMLDREQIRNQLSHAIEKQTGRKLQFDQLSLRILPWPEVKVSNITLANMPNGYAKSFIQADNFIAKIDLWSLWHRNINFRSLQFSNVRLRLEKNKNNEKNWEFKPEIEQNNKPDSQVSSSFPKWKVNFESINLEHVHGWYDDEKQNQHVQFYLKTADIHQLDGNKIRFEIQGKNHQADFSVSGKLNHISDLLQYKKLALSFPVKFQLALSEYLHDQNVGNIHINGTVNDFVKQRGYSIALRGTILNLKNLNFLFPHANLPSIENITFNSVVEDNTLDSETKAKPQIKLLQLHTGNTRFKVSQSIIDLTGVQLTANQLNENINTQITGKIDNSMFRWTGDFGTLNNFQQILFSNLRHSIPVKGNFSSDDYTAQIYGTIGGIKPSLKVKFNMLNFDKAIKNIGSVKTRDIFYNGFVSLPFTLPKKSFHQFQEDLMKNLKIEGNITSKDFQINQFKFENLLTYFSWKNHILNLNPFNLKDNQYYLNADLIYNLTSSEPFITFNLHPSLVPMEWVEKKYKLTNIYSGPVQLVGYFTTKGSTYSQWIDHLTGHMGLAGVNGILKGDGLKNYIGKAAKTLPLKENITAQCLAIHTNINQNKLFFDTLTLQTKKFALNGEGYYFIPNQTLDFHLKPDIMLGTFSASAPVRISGTLLNLHVDFEKSKNKIFTLSINSLKQMMNPMNYCGQSLSKAKEQ